MLLGNSEPNNVKDSTNGIKCGLTLAISKSSANFMFLFAIGAKYYVSKTEPASSRRERRAHIL